MRGHDARDNHHHDGLAEEKTENLTAEELRQLINDLNVDEAAVVRRIFEACAAGEGLTRITKTLNDARVPAPRPQQGRPVGWAGSSVRAVLLRPLYRGEIVWNQTRKRDGWGQANRRTRAAGDWLRIPAPELRIVSEDLWHAAQERFTERQVKYAQAGRRRACTPPQARAARATAGRSHAGTK